MRTPIILAVALVALAACESTPAPTPVDPPRPADPAPRPEPDQCHAREHRRLIGRPRTEIPVPVLPALQRVACTTCPVTLDHNPRRLNFFYDADTGIIREVRCG